MEPRVADVDEIKRYTPRAFRASHAAQNASCGEMRSPHRRGMEKRIARNPTASRAVESRATTTRDADFHLIVRIRNIVHLILCTRARALSVRDSTKRPYNNNSVITT